MKKFALVISLAVLVYAVQALGGRGASAAAGASVDPLLISYLSKQLPGVKVTAVITYDRHPGAFELSRLQTAGVVKGFALRRLPMIIADLNLSQVNAVRAQPGVVSVWGNDLMKNFLSESRAFIGVPQLMSDAEVTKRNTNNPGLPVSGKGIGIGYIDTGIDGTQPDLKFGTKVVQNVQQPLANGVVSDMGLVVGMGVSVSDLIAGTGFVPPVYVDNVPTSDIESGHGTHGAGVAAGTGQNSGALYGGVARGAHLVGVQAGDDKGLPLVAILGAYDYLLVHQFDYNIRIINNSWGSGLTPAGIDPNNPINVATRTAHDLNIVVVFAAGNSGDERDAAGNSVAINPYSTMPWTISVAAGEKRGLGTPAGFSSRGVDNGTGADTASQPADPSALPNLRPDITAPGVAIISVRAHAPAPGMTASSTLNNDHKNIAPAYFVNYYSSQGTSFACPHVSGVVALMLEANPSLTPAEVFTILRGTANPMPYEERVVGAGYVDAHNAVRSVMGLSAVAHPANLFPNGSEAEISDVVNDQTGTTAQDIRGGDFAYDAATRQIVYTLTLEDLSVKTPNMRWTMSSKFGPVEVFAQAAINEQNQPVFNYGFFDVVPNTTTRRQKVVGAADSGEFRGNQVIVRVSLDKVNATVGSDVLYTASTGTQAVTQILVGSPVNPNGALPVSGLLLAADTASGSDFRVGTRPDVEPTPTPTATPTPTPTATPTPTPDPTPTPTPDPTPTPTPDPTPTPTATPSPTPNPTPTPAPSPEAGKFDERYSGQLVVGSSSVELPFVLRRSTLDALITSTAGNEEIVFELLDAEGRVVAAGSGRDRKMALAGLAPGNYTYRVRGTVNKNVDFTIKSTQGR